MGNLCTCNYGSSSMTISPLYDADVANDPRVAEIQKHVKLITQKLVASIGNVDDFC